MANTAVNTSAIWIEAGASFTSHLCNPEMQLALAVHAKALELAANLGTNYTSNFQQLIADSEFLFEVINPDQVRAAEVAYLYQIATNKGGIAIPPATTDAKLEAAKTLLQYPKAYLERAKMFLDAALGNHTTF